MFLLGFNVMKKKKKKEDGKEEYPLVLLTQFLTEMILLWMSYTWSGF